MHRKKTMQLFPHGKHGWQHGSQACAPNEDVAQLGLILGLIQHTCISMILDMLWSIDTGQSKVTNDQYHMTISQAQV